MDLGTVSRASSRTSVRSQAKKSFKIFFSKIFLSPVRSDPVRWAHLSGWTSGPFHVLRVVLPSDRRQKKIIFLKKFSKIFLSPVRSCGRHSGFHVLPFVLPSDRRKKRRRVHGRQTHGGAALWVSQHREGSKPDKKKRCFPANTQFRQLIFLAF